MSNLVEVKGAGEKTTYSIPVIVTGGLVLLLTIVAAMFGIMSSAQVREPDAVTINQAKTEANTMVPVQNPAMKETIDNALLDTASTTMPANLNLRNPFMETLGGDRSGNPPLNPGKAASTTPPPGPSVNKIQAGAPAVISKNNLRAGIKMPETSAAPTLPSFESRYQNWEQQLAEAQKNKMPEPSVGAIYSIKEVVPTGYLASGDRKLVNFEVRQADKNLDDSFSLEQGERLFDAVVSEVTETGVFYQLNDGARTFTPFVSDRDNPRGSSSQPAGMPEGNSGKVSKIIPGQLKAVIEHTAKNDSGDIFSNNLLAKFDVPETYARAGYFIKAENVAGPPTDRDYFHTILLPAGATAARAVKSDEPTPCSDKFVGETIRYTSAANLTLNEFLDALQKLYKVSFIVDKDVPNESVVLKVMDKPWNYVLEAILRSKSLEARCLTGDIISIEPKGKQTKVDQENQKTEPLILRKYTLRYVPLNSSSTAQIAGSIGGSTGGNGGPGIEGQINLLLNRGGDNRASVSRIPNSNILAIYATELQQKQISEFISEIDKPGFQVIIETNFYTVNDSNFKDLGGQFSAIVGNGLGNRIGGITNVGSSTDSSGTGTTTGTTGTGLPTTFGTPSGTLRAASANTLFGASFTVGTTTFQALFSAAQQKGLANSQARSTQAVLDGGTTEIKNGDTIIIPTTGSTGGSLVTSGAITVNATQSAAIQPQVVVDENGNPVGVTLNLQLTNNSINRAYLGTSTPVVATQSQSGTVRLPLDQTYVVSGFFNDTEANTRNETPGVSRIPGLGELFKRRLRQSDHNRLYFAISVHVVRDTDLMQVPAPTDIDASPVPPPAAQEPSIRKQGKKKKGH